MIQANVRSNAHPVNSKKSFYLSVVSISYVSSAPSIYTKPSPSHSPQRFQKCPIPDKNIFQRNTASYIYLDKLGTIFGGTYTTLIFPSIPQHKFQVSYLEVVLPPAVFTSGSFAFAAFAAFAAICSRLALPAIRLLAWAPNPFFHS